MRRVTNPFTFTIGAILMTTAMPTDAATVRTETPVDAPADFVWAAVKDVGAVHTRLARGFVSGTTLEGDMRTVTFANGMVVKEVITGIDDTVRRLAYSAVEGRATHHAASIEVVPDGQGCRLVWVTDVLPEAMAEPIRAMMEAGAAVMKATLEEDAARMRTKGKR